MNKFFSKYDIDFRQTKYKLPAIMYIPVFIVGCLFINIFFSGDDSAAGAENRNDYIDGNMPSAKVDSTIQGKSLDDDYGGGDVDGDGRISGMASDTATTDASGFRKDDYKNNMGNDDGSSSYSSSSSSSYGGSSSSSYGSADLDEIRARQEADRVQTENYHQMQRRVRSHRSRTSSDDYVAPVSSSDIARVQEQRRERMMRDINNDLYGSGAYSSDLQGQGAEGSRGYYDARTGRYYPGGNGSDGQGTVTGYDSNGNPVYSGGEGGDGQKGRNGSDGGRDGSGEKEKPFISKAHKVRSSSRYFNTISENTDESNLIEAIIDENIKCVEGSRVRLKLLDDIEVGGHIVKKGTRLYVTMSGFGSQRVKGTVQSILIGDQIYKTDLAIYDMDGIEGLYVPESSFRQSAKDIGTSLTQGADFNTMTSTSTSNVLKNWASNAVSQTSQRAMDAIRKRIEKNVVHLKFGTRVYLINSSNLVEQGR